MKYVSCLIFALCMIGCTDNHPDQYTSYSKVMHTIPLTETDMCANVILTIVCLDHICNRHITSVKVPCSGK